MVQGSQTDKTCQPSLSANCPTDQPTHYLWRTKTHLSGAPPVAEWDQPPNPIIYYLDDDGCTNTSKTVKEGCLEVCCRPKLCYRSLHFHPTPAPAAPLPVRVTSCVLSRMIRHSAVCTNQKTLVFVGSAAPTRPYYTSCDTAQ
jgi:hypothetical protein